MSLCIAVFDVLHDHMFLMTTFLNKKIPPKYIRQLKGMAHPNMFLFGVI